jgi:hypothetical protein
VRCKEINSDIIFDATLYGEDVVMVRQSSPDPMSLFFISLDLFVERFEELCIPPDSDDLPATR